MKAANIEKRVYSNFAVKIGRLHDGGRKIVPMNSEGMAFLSEDAQVYDDGTWRLKLCRHYNPCGYHDAVAITYKGTSAQSRVRRRIERIFNAGEVRLSVEDYVAKNGVARLRINAELI